ncbi:5-methyltetrahydrofolate--homocysteine methyltransferase [Rheinheimera sediminis]|uniref:5-methyltetrahydrofolate--homocysteine methyltransferase n=1 Tax=Rheinheimera sp. YQF-1 TaxID=2499626 RepID=UPI000FD8017E|nr:5-methyltetrahydrofolate--homocysteine methyltransferase [Rheinheimera sp. YQF-1]RVT45670.1 5-methyltetrahydrofolate--homocysteine methyltransferase [Rheinheimera sp. YQF-1]
MLKSKVNVLALLISASLLAACGDSTTNIVEKDPIPVEDDHDHETGAGRLVISDKDSTMLRVYNLEDGDLLGQFSSLSNASALYASASQRFAMVVQRESDKVEFIDGGLYQEDHGDHLHPYEEEPRLMSLQLSESRPTHVTTTDEQIAIFFDGNVATSSVAKVAVLNDDQINTGSNDYPVLTYSTHMHGAAQARGEMLVSTIRDAATASTLPDQVGVYHVHGDHFHLEQEFALRCPGLHGSAQNKDYVSFGCTDGVMLLKQDGETFTASKVAHTADFTGTMRIGTLEGVEDAPHFIGFAGATVFSVNPVAGSLNKVDWQGATGANIIGYGFADHGEKFVLLDSTGALSILNYNAAAATGAAFALANKVQITTADLTTMPTGSQLQLAISAADDKVYVADPLSKTVSTIDLEEAKVIEKQELGFTPHKMVWVGIPAGHDDH